MQRLGDRFSGNNNILIYLNVAFSIEYIFKNGNAVKNLETLFKKSEHM